MDASTAFNIVGLVLGIGAIVLSFWFYRESNRQNKETAILNVEIREAVKKLEQLYDRTYTDTFAVLRNQMDAMQKHIFTTPTVGRTNAQEPDKVRMFVLGCVSQTDKMTIEELCDRMKDYDNTVVREMVYTIHREGIVAFDGKLIVRASTFGSVPSGELEGPKPE